MDYLRTIISGKKKRHIEDRFNLDLSYITPRIIAMSIPGEGLTKFYRNSLDLVSDFLEEKHHNHYLIFNLSGIKYDYEKFDKQVREFPWQDHYPPPIDLMFTVCKEIEKWINANRLNIIAVNCRAGKGRTGTIICCFLIYSGRFTTAHSALMYYQNKRFKEGGGVTQPSQVRYVKYFAEILTGSIKSPLIASLKTVHFRTSPHFRNNTCRPIVEVYYKDRLVYSNKQNERDNQVYLIDEWEDNRLHAVAVVDSLVYLQGDILCRIIHWGKFKYTNICRFSFNTAFIPYNNVLVLRKYEVDPYKFAKSDVADAKFAVVIEFERLCECKAEMKVEERCEICLKMMSEDEKEKWEEIGRVVNERDMGDPSETLFGFSHLDDVEAVIEGLDQTQDLELFDYD